MSNLSNLKKLVKLVQYGILTSTTAAGSGHPTSSLSATELMTTLMFGGHFHHDLKDPKNPANDRMIFSKGHASPLLYSLYHAAGVVSFDELLTLRQFTSRLEGHPTPRFEHIEVGTGSLGQGLSIGLGMALAINNQAHASQAKIKRVPKVYVLMGDSEFAEGQIWEAIETASYYEVGNLVGILDVNRLGQRGATMLEWDLESYKRRIESFGWDTIVIKDGHNISEIAKAFDKINSSPPARPTMIIAKTKKGHGISFIENKDNWHGKALAPDELKVALDELGDVDTQIRGSLPKPTEILDMPRHKVSGKSPIPEYKKDAKVATREAYGDALAILGGEYADIVVLDAEVSNSTYANKFQKKYPERFYEMYICEQNMVSAALGFDKRGFVPFASTFACFLTRAFDQIRMLQYSDGNVKIVGSHAGVSIGQDGSSQMALEDIAMMRSVLPSVVLYPSDGISTARLVDLMAQNPGIFYMRTTRAATPILYDVKETFKIGGSKVLRESPQDKAVIFAAGITLHEALKAADTLKKSDISVAVVDLYSIKPLDEATIRKLAKKTEHVIVVEDHYPAGGIGEAVMDVLKNEGNIRFDHLAVRVTPRSGTPEELMEFAEIDAGAIIKAVKS